MKFSELNNLKIKQKTTQGLDECFAKTTNSESNIPDFKITVLQHCTLVGYITLNLIATIQNEYWNKRLPKNMAFIAAIHDIGKVSPTFQKKLHKECNLSSIGNNLSNLDDKNIGYHTSVGEACLHEYNKTLASLVGQHHGYSNANLSSKNSDKYGGPEWQNLREQLITELENIFSSNIDDIDDFDFDLELAVIVLSDWIGSSINIPSSCTEHKMQQLAMDAVANINFNPNKVIENLSFNDIFNFEPRQYQREFINIANSTNTYILEAPMGSGKTEAALYAAYNQLNKKNGLYFALPTRITSDFIYSRVDKFFSMIMPNHDIKLIHGGYINPKLGIHDAPGGDWFLSKKKSLIAPFGVGTIDQALMSVLRIKHHELRKFGLAGKIVIFDEVHSYDVYTSTLLYQLIKELEKLDATVIILSATLTRRQIINLLGSNENNLPPQIPYPCCIYKSNEKINCNSLPEVDNKEVELLLSESDDNTISEAIMSAEEGQQVLWIENTVKEAQIIFKIIEDNCNANIEIGLIHSRFTQTARAINEAYWINLYGKDSKTERTKSGRILIGTQILEQSLDIDADLLISRLAPIDLLFQRMGRLWRHPSLDNLRPKQAKRKTIVLITPDEKSKRFPLLKGSTSYIYARYILAKTLEVLKNTKPIISLPSDIRLLIESVYDDNQNQDNLTSYKQEFQKERNRLNIFALSSLNKYGPILPEEDIQTRYNDHIKTKILLTSYFKANDNKFTLYLISGEKIELNFSDSESMHAKRVKALLLENQIVETNIKLDGTRKSKLTRSLGKYIHLNDNILKFFVIAKVDKDGSLNNIEGNFIGLYYNKILGLYEKKEKIN